jgi:RNA polymerase sigma-70 factor (ECF subfamily)
MPLAIQSVGITRCDRVEWRASAGRSVPLFEYSMDQESDENLMIRVAARDQAAFAALYDRFSGSLHALVRRILEDEQETLEVLQEGFLYIWEHASSYDIARSKAFTWAVIIFRHKAIDRLRSLRRRSRLADQAAVELLPYHEGSIERSDQAAERGERATLVHQALLALPDDQRKCIEWAFLKGYTHHQLSELFGAPLGTVKTHIRRGLVRLRDLLKGGLS